MGGDLIELRETEKHGLYCNCQQGPEYKHRNTKVIEHCQQWQFDESWMHYGTKSIIWLQQVCSFCRWLFFLLSLDNISNWCMCPLKLLCAHNIEETNIFYLRCKMKIWVRNLCTPLYCSEHIKSKLWSDIYQSITCFNSKGHFQP